MRLVKKKSLNTPKENLEENREQFPMDNYKVKQIIKKIGVYVVRRVAVLRQNPLHLNISHR